MAAPVEVETEMVALKILVLHRPTHDPETEAQGEYPYSWHFAGRRRLWEVRVQARFKELPASQIHFGLEAKYMPHQKVSVATVQVRSLLLRAIRAFIGVDFYRSPGDDPAKVRGEPEPPTIAMPLWAIDQFHVAEPGQEPPDLCGDLSGVGHLRTQGMKAYVRKMEATLRAVSRDRVYTFCFWGVSQYLDAINWEILSFFPGLRMDANSLCGAPPAYVVAYELDLQDGDRRHLVSRKRYYFKVALWSMLKPPEESFLRGVSQVEEEAQPPAPHVDSERFRAASNRGLGRCAPLVRWLGHCSRRVC